MSSDKKKKMKQNWERQKSMDKQNDSDESDFSENEILDLNSLRPFKFEPKNKYQRYYQ